MLSAIGEALARAGSAGRTWRASAWPRRRRPSSSGTPARQAGIPRDQLARHQGQRRLRGAARRRPGGRGALADRPAARARVQRIEAALAARRAAWHPPRGGRRRGCSSASGLLARLAAERRRRARHRPVDGQPDHAVRPRRGPGTRRCSTCSASRPDAARRRADGRPDRGDRCRGLRRACHDQRDRRGPAGGDVRPAVLDRGAGQADPRDRGVLVVQRREVPAGGGTRRGRVQLRLAGRRGRRLTPWRVSCPTPAARSQPGCVSSACSAAAAWPQIGPARWRGPAWRTVVRACPVRPRHAGLDPAGYRGGRRADRGQHRRRRRRGRADRGGAADRRCRRRGAGRPGRAA